MNDLIQGTRDVLKSGEIYGGVQIIEYAGYNIYRYRKKHGNHTLVNKKQHFWKIRCLVCNKEKIVRENEIRRNPPLQSCGCTVGYKSKEANFGFIHGLSHTRLYDIWHTMKQRCFNETGPEYHRYGGRGITICNEWLDDKTGFINFHCWAYNNGYDPKAKYISIERIDTDKGYCPENCTFTTSASQQCNNKSNNVYVIWGGIEYTLTELCRHFGVEEQRVFDRMHDGKSIEEAVLMPKTRTGNAGRVDRQNFMQSHPLVSDGTKMFQNHNAINPFVCLEYPYIDTNDPKLTYFEENGKYDKTKFGKLAELRGISPVQVESEEEYQKAREAAKQSLIEKLNNQ